MSDNRIKFSPEVSVTEELASCPDRDDGKQGAKVHDHENGQAIQIDASQSERSKSTQAITSLFNWSRPMSGIGSSSGKSGRSRSKSGSALSHLDSMLDMPLYTPRSQKRVMRQFSETSLNTSGSFMNALPKLDLLAVMRDTTQHPVSLSDFKDYLESVEFGSEALDFWLAVEELKAQVEPTITLLSINQIVDVFIRAGASCEINIDYVTRQHILQMLEKEPQNPTALFSAQKQSEQLLRNGAFPRFLHKATYRNIGGGELNNRRNMFLLGLILLAVFIPLAFTQTWFKRADRFYLVLPFALTLVGLQQMVEGFCPMYAIIGFRSLRSHNFYGLRKTKSHPAEPIVEPCVRSSQRRKAFLVWSLGIIPLSVGLTLIIWGIPVNIH